jgi:L-malate glycosyltransferase
VTAVHQFVPALLPRDATGDHTLALRHALRAAGWTSEIYVEAAHDELQSEATYFERYPDHARPDDILLYQLSTASPVADFLRDRPERLVLDYHNVTPPAFYQGWEGHTRDKVALALEQAAMLAPRATLGIADSSFNAGELESMGCPRTAVIPILVDIERRGADVDVDERTRLAAQRAGATVLLFVGRFSPNKAQHRLIEALWLYRRWYEPEARLHLVGPAVTPTYARAVMDFAEELGLTDAVRHGEDLSDAQLAAWYEDADVFVCLSEHEGFCIPLLEAMHASLPVVAFDAGAVSETLGDAGLLLADQRPSSVAAAVHTVRTDPGLAGSLVAAGARRLRAFQPAHTAARFVETLSDVAAETMGTGAVTRGMVPR